MLIEAGFSASAVGAPPTLRIIYYSNCGPESRRSGLRMSSSSGDRVSAVLYQVDPDNPSRNSLVTTRALGPCHCSLDPEVESTLAAWIDCCGSVVQVTDWPFEYPRMVPRLVGLTIVRIVCVTSWFIRFFTQNSGVLSHRPLLASD